MSDTMHADADTAPIDLGLPQCRDTGPRGLRSRLLRLPGGWWVEARTEGNAIVGELVTPGSPTPRDRLRESLLANARVVASWPAYVRAAINTREIFNPRPPEAK
jgi:hypothetical protein